MAIAAAKANSLGIGDSYRVRFDAPVRIGTNLLPAGEYTIGHTMEGQDYVMVFSPVRGKIPEVKAKCTLVPLTKKADRSETIYAVNGPRNACCKS